MHKEEIEKRIKMGRRFMHMMEEIEEYDTDQDLGKPQPPLYKETKYETSIDLLKDFSSLSKEMDFLSVINNRCSHRVYSEENISLLQLSYLLWCAQGVKSIRGKRYATLRTVPSGGGRHEFEVYLCINHVEGLQNGYYHYLPNGHKLELINEEEDVTNFLSLSLEKQDWAKKASVVFYLSMVAYRAEWRYGIYAHRIALVDAGYVSENIYLACTSIG
ncbi:MAG: SagB/ThcOx family dehydrogenase [Solobacterium sp.]|nr:SagB/ThcOx family dehydrogenase [Solobacterium sp.]